MSCYSLKCGVSCWSLNDHNTSDHLRQAAKSIRSVEEQKLQTGRDWMLEAQLNSWGNCCEISPPLKYTGGKVSSKRETRTDYLCCWGNWVSKLILFSGGSPLSRITEGPTLDGKEGIPRAVIITQRARWESNNDEGECVERFLFWKQQSREERASETGVLS